MNNTRSYRQLTPWTEVVGTFQGFSVEWPFIYVKVGDKILQLPNESSLALYFQENCDRLIGAEVGVLKTDLPEKPFLIRLIRHLEGETCAKGENSYA